jgi:hypothetical protein
VYWFYKLLFVCLYDVYMLKKVKPLKMFRFSQPPMSIFQLDTFRFFLYLMRICCQKTLKPRSEFKFQNYLSLLHFLFTSCLINSMNFPIRSKIHVFYPIFYLKENLGIFLSNTIGISHWAFTWWLLCFLPIFTLTLLDGKKVHSAALIDELCKIPRFLRFPL